MLIRANIKINGGSWIFEKKNIDHTLLSAYSENDELLSYLKVAFGSITSFLSTFYNNLYVSTSCYVFFEISRFCCQNFIYFSNLILVSKCVYLRLIKKLGTKYNLLHLYFTVFHLTIDTCIKHMDRFL